MDNELGLGKRGGLPCMGVGIGSPFTSLLMFLFTSSGVQVGLACGYDAVQRSIAMSGCAGQVAGRILKIDFSREHQRGQDCITDFL